MSINQFFNEATLNAPNICSTIQNDNINWDNADQLTRAYRNNTGATIALSYILDRASIEQLLAQDGHNLDGIKLYMAYEPGDATYRLFAVAAQYDNQTNEYDDYNIPEVKPTDISTLPRLCASRPCPPQCGKTNFLNS